MGISSRALLRNLTTNTFRRIRHRASTLRPGSSAGTAGSSGSAGHSRHQPGASGGQEPAAATIDWELWAWDMADALGKAMDDWKSLALLKPITVNNGIGMINPGDITGPALTSLAPPYLDHDGDADLTAIRSAITDEVSDAWKSWHDSLHGPLTFPTLLGGGDHQPTTAHCQPTMLSALASSGAVYFGSGRLKAFLGVRLVNRDLPEVDQLIDAMALALETTFKTFKASTVITDVQATGGVATGAPGFLR